MNIFDASDEQLREWAKRYDVEVPRTASRKELEDLAGTAIMKHQMALEEKAKQQRTQEVATMLGLDPATKAKPAPETISIVNSPKVFAVFQNAEEEGVDVTFNKGCTHTFHLWDGFLHVLPKCIVDELRDLTVPSGKRPVYARRPHPSIPNMECDTVVGHRRRFNFEIAELSPSRNAEFGVVLDRKIYEKCGVPFPIPQVVARVG